MTSCLGQFRSLDIPNDAEIAWLLGQGIEDAAMLAPWPIRAAFVRFDRQCFDFDPSGGQRAIIFRADDQGEPIDLIAWSSRACAS